ncbi:hypothetical protein K466DRAFT_94812 [Polyporus arcularius HHB13444]|uniref:Uncharacterized protein n=1 Tax=Polyporus arcularius HHB13444 TaxID=1314778 RepID=A0A5C3PDS7_9APHY|nr:hypothetical protein K466DRAFT_94812 [Polyporus arcularius HHB13444]
MATCKSELAHDLEFRNNLQSPSPYEQNAVPSNSITMDYSKHEKSESRTTSNRCIDWEREKAHRSDRTPPPSLPTSLTLSPACNHRATPYSLSPLGLALEYAPAPYPNPGPPAPLSPTPAMPASEFALYTPCPPELEDVVVVDCAPPSYEYGANLTFSS